jgi:hypothetical protein
MSGKVGSDFSRQFIGNIFEWAPRKSSTSAIRVWVSVFEFWAKRNSPVVHRVLTKISSVQGIWSESFQSVNGVLDLGSGKLKMAKTVLMGEEGKSFEATLSGSLNPEYETEYSWKLGSASQGDGCLHLWEAVIPEACTIAPWNWDFRAPRPNSTPLNVVEALVFKQNHRRVHGVRHLESETKFSNSPTHVSGCSQPISSIVKHIITCRRQD